uniref:Uncharacterized protein n=1 Tax=Oryzias latipes TaxID=8090 RepID=A0A3P9J323_ORYLA
MREIQVEERGYREKRERRWRIGKGMHVDVDPILQKIYELNAIADPVQLKLYRNGIGQSTQVSFQERKILSCMDIVDGDFPTELQDTFPDVGPFQVCSYCSGGIRTTILEYMDRRGRGWGPVPEPAGSECCTGSAGR